MGSTNGLTVERRTTGEGEGVEEKKWEGIKDKGMWTNVKKGDIFGDENQ